MPEKAKVYFLALDQAGKIKNLLPQFTGRLGVKVHFGEKGNVTFVPAEMIRTVVSELEEPTLIECSVLYKSPRSQAASHKQVAIEHGFDFAPIDFLDGEQGDDSQEVSLDGQHFKKAYLGAGLEKYNSLLVLSHFKAHRTSGFGGALKNLGMGLASRRGKLALHAEIKHSVNTEKCVSCGACLEQCPAAAITMGVDGAIIDQEKCISCSKCISVCDAGAIGIPWGSDSRLLQERIAEYAAAVVTGRQCFYVNFVMNITKYCDCAAEAMPKLTPDIGILVSADPIAIDQASYDLVLAQYPEFSKYNGDFQLAHGERLGLGTRQYELIK